jgi:hypothetical protein
VLVKRVNVFETDHPMISKAGRTFPRQARGAVLVILAYPVWLLLLGPLWALDGRGFIDFIPSRLRGMVYLSAYPVFRSHSLSGLYEAYMNWWYDDPNAAETTE